MLIKPQGEKITSKQNTITEKKENPLRINFIGILGKHLLSLRGLKAELANKYVGVQGIIIRVSIVKLKLVYSNKFWKCKRISNEFNISIR